MNNTPNSGGRKKRVTQGNGNVGKTGRDEANGPVGCQDGYAGRHDGAHNTHQSGINPQGAHHGSGQNGTQHGSSQQNAHGNNGSQDDRGLGTDIIGAVISGMASNAAGGNNNNSSNSAPNLIGSLLGGSQSSGHSSSSSSGSSGSGLGKIIKIALVILAVIIVFKTFGGNCSGLSDILGEGGSGGLGGLENFSQSISTGYDNFSLSDASAPVAISASTSTSNLDTTVSNAARGKYTTIKGGGNDEVTVMVFLCGTDLESKYGMATNDLNEMLHATLNDEHLNIIVETGGTKQWKNTVISNTTNQIYRVRNGGIECLEKDVGNKSMTDPATLTEFIRYCSSKYPANRNMLILWDHGGGSLSGYGYDQKHSGSMTLDKINKALRDGGIKFDFIGFDACLMATMETAVVTEQYADYLIGSEETEPGCGWYYTNWLTKLSKNPSIKTVELAKTIIDDFNDVCKKNNAGDSTTLSIVDLAEFAGTVPEAFNKFASNIGDMLDGSEYEVVADARSGAREFGASSGINHVDLIHLASRIGTKDAQNLADALKGCIKYNRTSRSMTNSYGMSIYFPFTSFSGVNSAVSLYNSIGMDSDYSACLRSFASLAAGGQIATGGTSSPIGSLFGELGGSGSSASDLLSLLLGGSGSGSGGDLLSTILGGSSDWFDSGRVLQNLDYYDDNAIYSNDMLLTEKDGGKVLSLGAKWSLVENVRLNVFLDDGEGYIDLGMDNVYEFDKDGDLKIDYDRTWLALDGQVVPYYVVSEAHDGEHYAYIGRVPAMLNGERVDIMIAFDDEKEQNEYGYVLGARYIYTNDETDTIARGLVELKDGDKLEFLCDYYSYDKGYNASYYFGEPIIVKGDIEVSNVEIGDAKCLVTYCLTDIFANEFWTEAEQF